MKGYNILLLCIIGLYNINCTYSSTDKKSITTDHAFNKSKQLAWPHADSLEFLAYPDSSNPKEHHKVLVRDRKSIEQLLLNLNQPINDGIKECIHDSKLYMFHGKDVFKTIYISDSCNYLAFAINSKRYFIDIDNNTRNMINELRKLAK